VGRAKEIQKAQKALEAGNCPLEAVEELKPVMDVIDKVFPETKFEDNHSNGEIGFGSTIFAVKPGDGSAREQAASCQKYLEAGQTLQMSMQPSVTARTSSTGVCFRSSSRRRTAVQES